MAKKLGFTLLHLQAATMAGEVRAMAAPPQAAALLQLQLVRVLFAVIIPFSRSKAQSYKRPDLQ